MSGVKVLPFICGVLRIFVYIFLGPLSLVLGSIRIHDTLCHTLTPRYSVLSSRRSFLPADMHRVQSLDTVRCQFFLGRPGPLQKLSICHFSACFKIPFSHPFLLHVPAISTFFIAKYFPTSFALFSCVLPHCWLSPSTIIPVYFFATCDEHLPTFFIPVLVKGQSSAPLRELSLHTVKATKPRR